MTLTNQIHLEWEIDSNEDLSPYTDLLIKRTFSPKETFQTVATLTPSDNGWDDTDTMPKKEWVELYYKIGMSNDEQQIAISFDGTSTYANDTTDADSAATGDMEICTTTATSGYYWGHAFFKFGKFHLDMSSGTAMVGGTATWQYWNGAWTPLSVTGNPVDHDDLTTAQDGYISWTIPADWVKTTVNDGSQDIEAYWIRVVVTGTISQAATADSSELQNYDATVSFDFDEIIKLNPKPSPLVLEMERRLRIKLERIVDGKRGTGLQCYFLKRRHYGLRCSNCHDAYTNRQKKTHCGECYDTTFTEGYYSPIAGYVEVISPDDIVLRRIYGKDKNFRTIFITANYCWLQPEDVIVVVPTNKRYLILTNYHAEEVGYKYPSQFLEVEQWPASHIIYDFEIS